ncbi:MAG TPA: peptide chain release factor N(5)-glutamine methyltransferase [Pyrinomonadaceae bacterium]|nr:peptide chain release factor N(5)-glutamine methyltransferase [Pyrinomonadaceae bacterium]
MEGKAGEAETVAGALREAAARLRASSVAEPRREAASLLAHATGRDTTFLFTHSDDALSAEQLSLFRSYVARRAAGEPSQYIRGRQEFYGLDFEVTPDVLIPRPETELLVETALELLKDTRSPYLCDVGAGSGCISVALLAERRDARALALDISPAALRVAERNAARNNVADRARFLVSDCFDALRGSDERFDLIASNPPYVAEAEMETLQREVRDYEPRAALTPGGDGLSIVRRLVADAPRFLKPGGHLLVEIGYGQHERVRSLVDPGAWALLGIREDLQGIPRTVALRRRL